MARFTYKKNRKAGGYDVHYQGLLDSNARLLCTIRKTEEGRWEVPLPNGPLGPFRDRWLASYAYLGHLLDEPAKTLDMKVRCQWAELDLRRHGSRVLDAELAGKIYDILVEKCRAPADEKSSFVHSHTERPHTCTEWRFCGLLGFGGKFRNHSDRLFVDCYRENEDPETLTIMAETNEAIFKLYVEHGSNA